MTHSDISPPSIAASQEGYSIALSAVASNFAFSFVPDEISHDNKFREILDRDKDCLSLPNQENGDPKYYVDYRKDLPLRIGHNTSRNARCSVRRLQYVPRVFQPASSSR